MKKLIAIIILIASLSLIGCGTDQTIQGKYCGTYGLFNRSDMKCSNVQYKVIGGNVFWAIALSATIVAPIYFLGFSLYEPVPN